MAFFFFFNLYKAISKKEREHINIIEDFNWLNDNDTFFIAVYEHYMEIRLINCDRKLNWKGCLVRYVLSL